VAFARSLYFSYVRTYVASLSHTFPLPFTSYRYSSMDPTLPSPAPRGTEKPPPVYIPPSKQPVEQIYLPPVTRAAPAAETVATVVQTPYIQPRATFVSAVPLQALNQGPAPVDCPVCGTRAMTTTTYEAGSTTQFVPLPVWCFSMLKNPSLWAVIVCFFTCLGFIPYLLDGTKDVMHRCSNCGTLLARWNRNGATQVLAFPQHQ
jgi:lipopolysaccharide-induced tumor necrosis factor-alpha factor